jgi:hypothetical protein
MRHIQAAERDTGGSQASVQWTHVVRLREWNLVLDLRLPSPVRGFRLSYAHRSEAGVHPCPVVVAVEKGPIALEQSIESLQQPLGEDTSGNTYIPYFRPIAPLGDIVVSLSMTAKIEQSVACLRATLCIELVDLVLKTLPFRSAAVWIKLGIRVIASRDQAKV